MQNDVTLTGTFAANYTTGNAVVAASSLVTGVATAPFAGAVPTSFAIPATLAPAFADAVSYGLLENGVGAVDTLTVKIAYDGSGAGGVLTLSPLEDTIVSGYSVYADSAIGKFTVGTNSGLSTDEDFAEVGGLSDETFDPVGNFAVASYADGAGVDDGPVDDISGVTNSASSPSLSYSGPNLGPVSFGITWGTDSSSTDYVINAGFSNDTVEMALDYNDDGDYKLDLKVATGVGNLILEYGYGPALPTGAAFATTPFLTSTNDNYEVRFETALGGAAGAIGFNSDGSVALEGRYSLDTVTFGMEYSELGDDALFNVGDRFAAHNSGVAGGDPEYVALWTTAEAVGGVDLLGIGVSTDVSGIGLTLSYEEGNVGTLTFDETKLAAKLNDYVTVEYSDLETLTISVATSF